MAQSSWPFENIDTSETQFSQWARNIGEGVIFGKGFELETFADSTGMNVKVKSGQALVRGHYYSSSAEETLTVPTANPTNPRIDLIVARLDPAANSIVLALVTGTPASSPVAPTPTQTEADVYELPLAEVYVGAGVITIIAGNVTDLRSIFDPNASGAGVVFSDTAPEDTDSIWYNTENGNAYVYYDGFWTSISGISIPAGGTTGQVLAKTTNADYATQWVTAGLNLISTTTFSAVASQAIDGVFTTTYDDYRIVMNFSASATTSITYHLRASGVDTTTNYQRQLTVSNGSSISAARSLDREIGVCSTVAFANNIEVNMFSPRKAQNTISSVRSLRDEQGTGMQIFDYGLLQTSNTQFDGIKFTPSAGTITGTITIYGLAK